MLGVARVFAAREGLQTRHIFFSLISIRDVLYIPRHITMKDHYHKNPI